MTRTFLLVGLRVLCLAAISGCSLIASPDLGLLLGTGGSGGDGSGGSGGSAGECKVVFDCPRPANECELVQCEALQCVKIFVAAGSEVTTEKVGDCLDMACDGAGQIATVHDDADVPNDDKVCTADGCSMGMPVHTNRPAGAPCGANDALRCDGNGACVGCMSPASCPTGGECQEPTCTNGVCGFSNHPQGTQVAMQVVGDCKVVQCDGDGGTQVVNNNSDVGDDMHECTTDGCSDGTPMFSPVQIGTPCTEDGGAFCNATGSCVDCLVASDCPGMDTECQARNCNAGMCGTSFVSMGTPVSNQTAGDCKRNVCDGAGSFVAVNDDLDLPNDNQVCTDNVCNAGVPSNPPLGAGTTCGIGLICDGTGQCTGCISPSDCPGVDDDCKTRTCNLGSCGLNLTAAGTPVSSQVPNDCKRSVCDGSGNTVIQNDDADLPLPDAAECTADVCNAGNPSHPNLATNTPCSQNGGTVCNSGGVCVECNAAAQCTGTDTECQTRTCLGNACGFNFQSAGTPTATQTPGDCKQAQCDGSGGVMQVNLNNDIPLEDGNQCTDEACNLGSPQHPFMALNAPCTQMGGLYCDGAGACVECNNGSQCASMICGSTRTCQAASCTDLVQNGTETDVDCGGTCPNPCAGGQGCLVHGDCVGGACNPGTMTCAPTCNDMVIPGATCTSYCSCMSATCAGKFPSQAACIAACAAFSEPQLCCRAYHCTAAVADPGTHCPHAAGESVCP